MIKALTPLSFALVLLSGCAIKQQLPICQATSKISTAEQSSLSQVGRYETISNTASSAQINPLLTIVTFKFGPTVSTVGEAIAQVLQYSGYALIPSNQQSPAVKATLAKPLPYADRLFGPIAINDALTVLMGQEVFTLIIDPVHRLVNFELKPTIAQALELSHAQ